VVIEILHLMGGYDLVGLLDADPALWGSEVLGVPVLGGDALLSEIYRQGVRTAFIGVGTVKRSEPRRRLYEQARQAGFETAGAVHPRAIISPTAQIGDGPTIMAGAVINPDARVGNNVIINTGAIIEHDCMIGNHVHVATGARLAGSIKIGDGAHIGIGATIREGIRIGQGSMVGAGAVVVDDVPDFVLVVGVPAKIKRGVES
jgi:sugar O-acyltransferase (sialic acid O-acetyltransferase NeuD family)